MEGKVLPKCCYQYIWVAMVHSNRPYYFLAQQDFVFYSMFGLYQNIS